MSKNIFLLNGHPGETSLSRSFVEEYAAAAKASGHNVRIMHIHDLDFDLDFGSGTYSNHKPLEPELEEVLQNIEWSGHVVLAFPLWWGGLPAKLKGLFDRSFLAGRTFDTRNLQRFTGMPSPMLGGRSARVFITSDTPSLIERLFYRNSVLWQVKGQILGFVGITPTRFTWFSGASHPKAGAVDKWMRRVHRIGAAAA